MKKNLGRILPLPALLAGALAVLPARLRADANDSLDIDSPWTEIEESRSTQTPETILLSWPAPSRTAARALIEKYGPPDAYDTHELVWHRNGPWDRTMIFDHATWSSRADKNKDGDFLMQTVGYAVPPEKRQELRRFDPGLAFNPETGELSSKSASEGANFLALNLADEIVRGRRTVAEARRFYRYARDLQLSGKSSPYNDGLMFRVRLTSLDYPQ
jgi:hypothetical protein